MFSLADIGAKFKEVSDQLGSVLEFGPTSVGVTVDPKVVSSIQQSLQIVSNGGYALATAKTPQQGGETLGRINAEVNGVVNVLAGLPLPMEAAVPLRIASILLPTLQSAGQLLLQQMHEQQTSAAAKPAPAPQPAAPNGRNARSATPRQTPRESTG